jgi:DNA-binding HxlR family transcriptional regulator
MGTYEQYCPIARAAEIFAERWTPLIVRNIHAGSSTYGEILAGLPGIVSTASNSASRLSTALRSMASTPSYPGRVRDQVVELA